MFVVGTVSYVLSKCGFPLSPIALGLILGPIFEPRLAQTNVMFKGNFLLLFTRPICVVFMLIILISLDLAPDQRANQKASDIQSLRLIFSQRKRPLRFLQRPLSLFFMGFRRIKPPFHFDKPA